VKVNRGSKIALSDSAVSTPLPSLYFFFRPGFFLQKGFALGNIAIAVSRFHAFAPKKMGISPRVGKAHLDHFTFLGHH